ncbi:conserved unknown protein [Ectocarpus siliculosus]|uniref:C3H1-type domain-containing protein n=1 Tax=Ectocarpus siliculosus TaxID=2880 RepID=D7FIR3_ECTSI|nr:conserved unknown protein [Ectocarpus siliculosus]|eukprot:CBJ28880.1 conserved unknown protein [Ectocarpus siliculosus]
MRAAEQDRNAKAASKQAKTPKSKSKKGIPSSSIIEHNRKTELCRNYENGSCTFGDRCAFAHGLDDIKHKTLRDLEKEGRIADASKYQACLCQTWVATGTCLYGRRCVFIHDDRVKGTIGLSPRTSTLAKSAASRISSSTGSRGGGSGRGSSPLCPAGEDNDNGSLLFFPDRPRDPDSRELPADEVRYDIDFGVDVNTGRDHSTAYKLWYSFITVMGIDDSAIFARASNKGGVEEDTNHTSSGAIASGGTGTYPPPTTAKRIISYKDAASAGVHFIPPSASAARGAVGRALPTSSAVSAKLKQLDAAPPRSDNGNIDSDPLPVFYTLRMGIPACPGTPPPAAAPAALLKGEDVVLEYGSVKSDYDDDDDSYFSCPSSSSSWCSAVPPPPGLEGAVGNGSFVHAGAFSALGSPAATSDVASAVSLEGEDEYDGVIHDGFSCLSQHPREQGLVASRSAGPAAGAPSAAASRPSGTPARLAVFVGLHSDTDTSTCTSPSSSDGGDYGACQLGQPAHLGRDYDRSYVTEANSGIVPDSVGYGAAMAPPQYVMAHLHHRRQLCDGTTTGGSDVHAMAKLHRAIHGTLPSFLF